jgi:hypothetical protein
VFLLQNPEQLDNNEGYHEGVGTELRTISTIPWMENNKISEVGLSEVEINQIEYVEIFIDQVKEEPCLWNTALRVYKDQTKSKNTWPNIAVKIGKDSKSY